MRLGFFSDIHGNDLALESVLTDMDAARVEARVCLGDLAAFGPRPLEVLQRLEGVDDLMLVRGNTDRWLGLIRDDPAGPYDEQIIEHVKPALAWTLEQLPKTFVDMVVDLPVTGELEVGGVRIVAEHASPGSDWTGITPETTEDAINLMFEGFDSHVFACGHTHKPLVRRLAGGVLIINDGSVGYPYDGEPRPSWMLVDITEAGLRTEIRRLDYDREAVKRDMEDRKMVWREVMGRRLDNAAM